MLPNLCDGDFVVSCKWPYRWLQKNHIVVVESVRLGTLVKRIVSVDKTHGLRLAGDNAQYSVSPDKMGWQTRKQVLGRVILCVRAKQQ